MELNKEELIEYQERVELRQELSEKFLNARKKMEEEFQKEYAMELQTVETLNKEIQDYKGYITNDALADYKESDKKKLLGGIGIRVGTSLLYEPEEAFNWAVSHALCLNLDKKAFETIAKTQDIDFVKKEEKITVIFPKEIKFEEVI